MNKLIYNSLIILLIIIVLSCAFFNYEYQESFVPRVIKETYRPIARNTRIAYEGFYDKSSTDISNLFRKFGIL